MLNLKNQKKRDRAALVAELERAGAKFKGNAFLCPYHDDHRPSAGVFQADDGWRFKCQSCGAGATSGT